MSEYQNSKEHHNNWKIARSVGKIKIEENKQKRIKKYYENPSKCLVCDKVINYYKKINKFCSHSCSAEYNNKNRICKKYELSEEGRKSLIESRKRKNGENKY